MAQYTPSLKGFSITKVWSLQPGRYFCLSTRRKGMTTKGALKNHWFEEYQFHTVEEKILELRDSHHVWFCPHGFKRKIRQAEYAEPSHFLYADADGVHPRKTPIKGTIIIQSSPRRFVGLWYVGQPIEWERDNQSWTKLIGADAGGWDPTQVLRVPGSFNHKHADSPLVQLVKDYATDYELAQFRELMPQAMATPVGNTSMADFWDKLKPEMRRELKSGEVIDGKKSDRIWHMAHALTDAGASIDQAAAAILKSPCGQRKFQGVKALERLKRQIRKALNTGTPSTGRGDDAPQGFERELIVKSMDEYEHLSNSWIWSGRVCRGEVNVFAGDGGVGKGHVGVAIGASVSTGTRLPFHKGKVRQGYVMWLQIEDDPERQLKPRLKAAGADEKFCLHIDQMKRNGVEATFDITRDLDLVDKAMEQRGGKLEVLIIDPIADFLGVPAGDEVRLRAAMMPVRRWARERDVAVIVVLHLNKKSDNKNARQRMSGSVAMPNLSRSAFYFGHDPKDEDIRAMFHNKWNLTSKREPLAFTIKPVVVDKKATTKLEWLKGHEVDFGEQDSLDASAKKDGDKGKCADWVVETLSTGKAVPYETLLSQANARGYTKNQLEYAGRRDGPVKKAKTGFQGQSVWSLKSQTLH